MALRRLSRVGGFHRTLGELVEGVPVPRSRRVVGVVVVVLFAGLFLLGAIDPDRFDATLLFVVPIALAAIEFGLWGGLAAGVAALALVLGLDLSRTDAELDAIGYLSRMVTFLLLGGLLGRFVTVRRVLEDKIARSAALSLDLIATAGFDGYFKRLNRAWERTLGWSLEELYAQPLVEFVHPDDRERSAAEIAKVADGADSISFRNRYRHRDGSYRWLEWNAHVDSELSVIHASARDITVLQQAEQAIRRHGERLERTVDERTVELERARLETLQRLALAAEYRDDDTHQHTERVGHTSMLIARELGLPAETVETLRDAAPLHDVGKMGVSDAIMLKPGKLTAAEFQTMQQHTIIGAAILANSNSRVLQMAEQIALTHHERWDGTGYPDGLSGEEIPLPARITALADAFDAMVHTRPYKDAWPIERAIAEIRRCSGAHFDAAVVRAFLTLDHAALVNDREQTLGDAELEHAIADASTPDPATRDATTHHREAISLERDDIARERGQRDLTPDATARVRDQTADLRDRIADAHDADAREHDRWSSSQLDDFSDIADIREQASQDRARAGVDRANAGRDRQRARLAREQSAQARTQAAGERSEAAHGRDGAVTDPLTGARARAAGLAELQREIDRAHHTTSSLVLVIVDIDDLDHVNTTEGRPAGDQILAAVGSALRGALRTYDLILRFGGDEFLCAVSGIGVDEVRKRVSTLAGALPDRSDECSISAGFAELQVGDDIQQVIKRAQGALVHARRAG